MNCRINKLGATITSFALLATLSMGTVPANASPAVASETFAQMALTTADTNILNAQKSQIIEFEQYINQLRAEYGLNPVKFNVNASVEAYQWSAYMSKTGDFRHTVEEEVEADSVKYYSRRNENIAWSSSSSVSSMFNQWKTSDSHRINMLDPSATSFGVGFYTANGKTYGTTLLHTAKSTGYMPETYSSANAYYSGSKPVDINNTVLVNVPTPTVNKTDNSYTIPSATGVRYWNATKEEFVPAGTYKIYGNSLHLVPVMNNGYKSSDSNLISKGGWSWKMNPTNYKDDYSPAKPNVYGTIIALPYDEYVNYYVNGVLQYGYEYDASKVDSVKVTAKIKPDYSDFFQLDEYEDGWEIPIGTKSVYANTVVIDNKNLSYTIPSTTGVQYLINGVVRSTGTYKSSVGETINVSVKPLSGYNIQRQASHSFSHKFVNSVSYVTPSTPSFDTTNMTYTIPSTTGVTYKVNGSSVSAGTHKASYSTTYNVTAHANSGYALSGTSSWSKSYGSAPLKSVTPASPSFNTTNMTYTIPSTTGVTYKVNGATINAGTHKASYSTAYNVTAHANSGYSLNGTSSWSKSYGSAPLKSVTPASPSFDTTNMTYTIPSTTGVTYKVNGSTVNSGTHKASYSTTYNVIAHANSGYVLSGTSSWSKSYGSAPVINATPKAPTTDVVNGQYIIPSTTGVNYYVDGVYKAPGAYSSGYKNVLVTAKAISSKYAISGTSSWSLKLAKINATPKAPISDISKKKLNLPFVSGVNYYINGKFYKSGTYNVYSYTTVTAKASAKNYNVKETTWKLDYRTAVKPTAPKAKPSYVTIPKTTGVKYYVNGTLRNAGTYKVSGNVKVTASAHSGNYKLSGTSSWSYRFATPARPTNNASKNTITIPSTTGVNYYINNKLAKAGTHKNYGGYYTVTAKPVNGATFLSGTQSWKIDNRNSVTPSKVTSSASKNRIYIPNKTGVKYYINGKYAKAGTHSNYSGYYTVTAKASSGSYKLSGTTSWKIDNRNSVKPKAPSFSTSKNTVKINGTTGVKYYVNGAYKKSGTYKYKNGTTLKVTTKASSGYYKLSGTKSWTKKI